MQKAAVFIVLLALTACLAKEEKKNTKRGIFGESLGLGHGGLNSHLSLGSAHGLDGHDLVSGISGGNLGDFSHHGPIDLGSSAHKHITITKKVGIPYPKLYPVHVHKNIPVPVPHPVPFHVDRPYPVHVPKPYPVPVEKPVPYTVEKTVPYPVQYPVKVPVKVPVAVPYPAPYPVTVHKKVPVHIPEPVIVKKPVPVFIKSHDHSDIGSGSLGGFEGHSFGGNDFNGHGFNSHYFGGHHF